ncbi:hypothetical protein C8J56DRAFT_1044313 [Mycena floridula]|nr:hypothetical protein C8J56DRAFT_1044313 [Mycena floridula]
MRAACRYIFLLLLSTGLLSGFFYLKYRPPNAFYEQLALAELEQPTDRLARAVLFKQLQGAGFTNQVQEILLFHHLALLTSRLYVYQPFIWNPRKAALPLSAFLLGPTKNSINQRLFDEVCPPEEVKHVEIHAPNNDLWQEAQRVLGSDDRCLVVTNWIFNWRYLASSGVHAIWPSFQKYLADYFEWPSNIQTMISQAQAALNLRPEPSSTDGEPYMAVHLRRGDFEDHCRELAESRTGFTTWSTLPIFESSVFPPALDVSNQSSVIEHCYSSLRRILAAMDQQLRTRPHVRALYALHDGAWDHLNVYIQFYKLEEALKSPERAQAAGWSGGLKLITHSGMLPVQWGERDWKVAVDMELARKAEVFIGNGYSSLSSQIIALRLADGGSTADIGLL